MRAVTTSLFFALALNACSYEPEIDRKRTMKDEASSEDQSAEETSRRRNKKPRGQAVESDGTEGGAVDGSEGSTDDQTAQTMSEAVDPEDPMGPAPTRACPVDPKTGRQVPTYLDDVKPIIDGHCAGCHSTVKPKIATELELRGATTTQSIAAIEAGTMPPGAAPGTVTAQEILVLKDWAATGFTPDQASCPTDAELAEAAPTCTLTVDSLTVAPGSEVRVSLATVGKVSSSLWHDGVTSPNPGKPETRTFRPMTSAAYFVEVVGPGGKARCDAKIVVAAAASETGKRNARLTSIANEVRCAFCHMKVLGDLGTTRDGTLRYGAPHNVFETKGSGEIVGKVFAATKFNPRPADDAQGVTVKVRDGIADGHKGAELPLDRTGDGRPDFPVLNLSHVEAGVSGRVSVAGAAPQTIEKVRTGNVVLIGTAQNPIQLQGDVLIKGDLIIKGWYQGQGTIYVTGQIYVPANLRAKNSAFPYSDDRTAAAAEAENRLGRDALGLATPAIIHLGDVEHQWAQANFQIFPAPQGLFDGWDNVKTWYPEGFVGYRKLYDKPTYDKHVNPSTYGSIELVEAFLYAGRVLRGLADANSYSIRGGVITDYFAMMSGARDLPAVVSPVHGRLVNYSYVEYDHRMALGKLPILQFLMEAYP